MQWLLHGLADLVAPPRCLLCGEATRDGWACGRHQVPFGLTGARCGGCLVALGAGLPPGEACPRCRERPTGLAGGLALGDWEREPGAGGLRDWILALKHGGRRDLADPLGRRLGGLLAASGEAAGDARLVAVPLHTTRRFERGYDQAALLARAAAEVAGRPVLRGLERVRATPPQGSALAPPRTKNVRGAFRVPPRAARAVAGRELWLVDDVASSFATLTAAAEPLLAAGARSVRVLLLARAGSAVRSAARTETGEVSGGEEDLCPAP